MAQVTVKFGAVVDGVFTAINHQVEEVTSSGTSAATAIVSAVGDVAKVTNNGPEDVWVLFAATPTAVVGSGHFLISGATDQFGGVSVGDKCAMIDDS